MARSVTRPGCGVPVSDAADPQRREQGLPPAVGLLRLPPKGVVGVPDAILEDVEGRVVGREFELAAVGSFLAADAAVPAALVVEGEAGIGKTTIVQAALAQASSAGLRVLLARPGNECPALYQRNAD